MGRRVIGMDLHRTFAEVVVWEDGRLRHAGRVDMTRSGLEGFARVPFPLAVDITVNNLRLSHLVHLVDFVEQRYDFATAELTTVIDFRASDTTARMEVIQFCSHSQPSVP